MRKSFSDLKVEDYVQGILESDRVILSKAITLIESKKSEHREIADQILEGVLPFSGNSTRIGITGVPGAGKSTFIEGFGVHVASLGKKLAVLSIDPSSSVTKGSILGDKTRMQQLSATKDVFIRPSPSGSHLGGVTLRTRESLLLCEAAGYEIILVETVGVGQAETAVKGMVDFFLLLMLTGGGDELQGMKRGIMEMADAIIINKVDGPNVKAGQQAAKEFERALHLFPPTLPDWSPPVSTVSALEGTGIADTWAMIEDFIARMKKNDHFEQNRKEQHLRWFHEALRHRLEEQFFSQPDAAKLVKDAEKRVLSGQQSVRKAVERLVSE